MQDGLDDVARKDLGVVGAAVAREEIAGTWSAALHYRAGVPGTGRDGGALELGADEARLPVKTFRVVQTFFAMKG